MDDHGLVAAIVAGDPDGLTEAIDRYGPSLLADCRAVLEKPAADEVVLDTFVIARARLEGLADPGKLRSWLAAVARAECAKRAADAGLAIVVQPEAVRAEPAPADAETSIAFPQQLRGKILAVCTDETPAGRAGRTSAAHRAGPFGHDGFPRPTRPRPIKRRLPGQRGPGQRGPGWRGRVGVLAVAAGLAVVVVVAAAVLLTEAHPGKAAASQSSQNGIGQNGAPGLGLPGSSASGTGGSPGKATPEAGQHAAGTPSPGATASLLQAAHTSALPSASPQSTGRGPADQPTPGPSDTGNPSPSPSPTPQQAGTLVPSTNWLSVTSVNNQEVSVSFEVTAQGGPVSSYTIATSTPGRVSISPQTGSIPAGGTVVITVTTHTRRTFTTPLTLSPGGGVVRLHVIAVLPGSLCPTAPPQPGAAKLAYARRGGGLWSVDAVSGCPAGNAQLADERLAGLVYQCRYEKKCLKGFGREAIGREVRR